MVGVPVRSTLLRVVPVVTLLLGACAGNGEDGVGGEDSARPSETTFTGGVPVAFSALIADCSDGDICFWTATVTGEAGSVDLYLQETDDNPTPRDEHHWLFADIGGGAFVIALDLIVADEPYTENLTTTFDMTYMAGSVSWLVFVKDGEGAVADCGTGGADPTWWESTCP